MFDQPHIHLWQGFTAGEQALMRCFTIYNLAWLERTGCPPESWVTGYQMLLALKVACWRPRAPVEHAHG
jgi:hypothetical protein